LGWAPGRNENIIRSHRHDLAQYQILRPVPKEIIVTTDRDPDDYPQLVKTRRVLLVLIPAKAVLIKC